MTGYHYRECGLDNIWLLNGYQIHDTPYGRGVSFADAEGLDAAIAQALTEKPGRLTGQELRFLRLMLDMSQQRLGDLIGKSAQTVALWEKQSRLKPDADRLMRHIYRQTAINRNETYIELVETLDRLDHAEQAGQGGMQFRADAGRWARAA